MSTKSEEALVKIIRQAGNNLIAAHNDTRRLICPQCLAASFTWDIRMGHSVLRCRTPIESKENEDAECGYVVVCKSTDLSTLPMPIFSEPPKRR